MKLFSQPLRLAKIIFVMMRYNIDEILLGRHWFFPVRYLTYFNPFRWTPGRKRPRALRIRLAIEELGPIFVKAGQIASTRRDIIPADIADELAKLQDKVPPFDGQKARSLIENSLGAPIETHFSEFDPTALASASIAQVHTAKLLSGEAVIIKVLRPKISSIIKRDISLLRALAHIAKQYWTKAQGFKPMDIVDEVAESLNNELDLMREAANASQLKRNFADNPDLYIPNIYWNLPRQNILVMERIYGIPIYDREQLKAAGFDLNQIASKTIEVFFTQIFRDCFFHADLHPGNLFVSTEDPQNPCIIAVDFGITGSLNQFDQRYLAENMMAFFNRDYQKVAELHIACGWLPPDTRIDQFEGAIRAVSEPIFEQPLKNISFGQLLMRLFQVARQYNINIQPQLILLQKTLLNIEGLCRTLDPDIDYWGKIAPQVEKWLKNQVSAKTFFKKIRHNIPLWSRQLPELPNMLYEVLREHKNLYERQRFAEATANSKKTTTSSKVIYFIGGAITALAISAAAVYLS